MNNPKELPEAYRDGLLQFFRNGRWGTCVDCPRDSQHHAYPEFCIFSGRYDHQLTIQSLADQINLYASDK